MASDRLFEMLAQAKAQPDRWARAVNAGADAGNNIIGGILQGKQIGQQLEQYKLLNTPLGTMYSDPSQIPFGLSPNHTVKDLLTLAPAMENFAPANLMSGVAQEYGANVNSPQGQPSSVVRQPTQAPAPTIASTSMDPIPGSENPAPRPGTANLNADEGTGAGASASVAPGASPTIPQAPALNIPPGGMGMGAFKNLVIPALNAAREGRQFQQGQANENQRQQNSIAAENARFASGQNMAENQKQAELIKEYETGNTSVMSALDAYKQLDDAWNKVPPNQKGPGLGTALTHAGDIASSAFPEAVAYNKARLQLAGAITAGIDPKGRQGPSLLEKILQGIPTLGASNQTRNDLMGNIYNQTTSQANRNYQGYQAAAGSVGRNVPPPNIPSQNTQAPPNSTIPPSQTVTVRTSDGVLHKVPASNLQRVKQRDPGMQVIQ